MKIAPKASAERIREHAPRNQEVALQTREHRVLMTCTTAVAFWLCIGSNAFGQPETAASLTKSSSTDASHVIPQLPAGDRDVGELTGNGSTSDPASDETDIDSLDPSEILKHEEIVRRDPENTDALLKLATLLYSYHRSGEALPLWEKALSINPRLVEPYWLIGTVYSERGDIEAARFAYLEALKLDPGHVPSRANLAVIYREKGQLDAAENEYRTILRLDPEERDFTHQGLGQILAGKKRWQEAIEHYRMALEHDRGTETLGTALVQLDLAEALGNAGRLDEAEVEIEKAQDFLDIRMHTPDGFRWHAPADVIARTYFETARIRARQNRLIDAVNAVVLATSYDPSMLDKAEASDDLRTMRATTEYGRFFSETQTRLGLAPPTLEARFAARIKWIERMGEREVTVAAAEADARWLVAVEISGIGKPEVLFDTPGDVVLAVRSPVRLLARSRESAPGRSYDFVVRGEVREGKPHYRWARATETTMETK